MYLFATQRIIIKFLARKCVKPKEMLRRPQAQFLDNCLKKPQVYEWQKQFQAGREVVKNLPYDRRPRISLTNRNIITILSLIERD